MEQKTKILLISEIRHNFTTNEFINVLISWVKIHKKTKKCHF